MIFLPVGWIDEIDHDLDNVDNLDPNLPLGYVVRDLYGADPTQDTWARSCRLCASHPAA